MTPELYAHYRAVAELCAWLIGRGYVHRDEGALWRRSHPAYARTVYQAAPEPSEIGGMRHSRGYPVRERHHWPGRGCLCRRCRG